MRVTVPEKVTGARDALFVLEVEFPVASVERTVEVAVTGPVEPLDLSGSSRGGTYRVPVGLERLHVPLRVLEDGDGAARIVLTCTEGPEAGEREERALRIEAVAREGERGSLRRWLVGAAAVLAVGVAAFLLTSRGRERVPDLRGQDRSEAQATLAAQGWEVRTTEEVTGDPREVGTVVRQIPEAGTDAPDDRILELIVARAEQRTPRVPTVVGQREEDAQDTLDGLGYQVVVRYVDEEDASRAGTVVNQSPEGDTPLEAARQVEIFVARAPAAVTVPSVLGRSEVEARALLGEVGLAAEVGTVPTSEVRNHGRVLGQEPGGGVPLAPGSVVRLEIGRGNAGEPTAPEPPTEPPTPAVPAVPEPGPEGPITPGPEGPGAGGPGPVTPEPVVPEPVTPEPASPFVGPGPGAPLERTADGQVLIPDMTGWTRDEAEQRLREAGLQPLPTLVRMEDTAQHGRVISQRPKAGEARAAGAMVFLTVGDVPPSARTTPPDPGPAAGPGTLPPPEPWETTPTAPPEQPGPSTPSPDVPPQPEPGVRAVPDLVGLAFERALTVLTEAGFALRLVDVATDYPPAGTVLSQDPPPGDPLVEGGEVVLEVARARAGPETVPVAPPVPSAPPPAGSVAVPDVLGRARADAERAVRDAGLLVNVTLGGGSADEQGRVVDQAPKGGVAVLERTWVEIVVASGSGPRRTAVGGPMRLAGPSAPQPAPSPGLPPAVGTGPATLPPGTPRAPAPLPPVVLPPRDGPRTQEAPTVEGLAARAAIERVLAAGLLPIIEVDRSSDQPAGTVLRGLPAGGTPMLPGDLLRMRVSMPTRGTERTVWLPLAVGAEASRAREMFAGSRTGVEVIELRVPGHPYAGTRRIAAQYPVSAVAVGDAGRVTLWVLLP